MIAKLALKSRCSPFSLLHPLLSGILAKSWLALPTVHCVSSPERFTTGSLSDRSQPKLVGGKNV